VFSMLTLIECVLYTGELERRYNLDRVGRTHVPRLCVYMYMYVCVYVYMYMYVCVYIYMMLVSKEHFRLRLTQGTECERRVEKRR